MQIASNSIASVSPISRGGEKLEASDKTATLSCLTKSPTPVALETLLPDHALLPDLVLFRGTLPNVLIPQAIGVAPFFFTCSYFKLFQQQHQ